jgi:hypothetical protein
MTVPVDELNPSRTADALWEKLSETNKPDHPQTVGKFGRLCHFGRNDATGKLELHEHDADTMRDRLSKRLVPIKAQALGPNWVFPDEVKIARFPKDAIMALIKRPLSTLDEIAHVPRIDRIVDVPVFAADGTLVDRPGQNETARVYYDGPAIQGLAEDWDDDEVRRDDVRVARDLIMRDLLGDFPFADEASRAHAMSMVLEQFARALIDGPTPAYVVIAAEQGTGKSLLTQACLLPSCGRIDTTPEPDPSPQDFQKRLLSELIRGPQAIVFDNVTRELENSTLAAMITSGTYSDRVLGKSQILSFPVRHTTVFTMNNPNIGRDMRRRVVPIYLNAGVEKPWERGGPWRHADLLGWAASARTDLVRAAVLLVKHYLDGHVDFDHEGERYTRRVSTPRMMGSFERWSHVMGGMVSAAGVSGFGENMNKLYEEQSEDDSDEGQFLAEWPDGLRMTAAQVVQYATVGFDGRLPVNPPSCLRDRGGRVNAQSVAYGLRQLKGRVRGGRVLSNDRGARPTEWFVEQA